MLGNWHWARGLRSGSDLGTDPGHLISLSQSFFNFLGLYLVFVLDHGKLTEEESRGCLEVYIL